MATGTLPPQAYTRETLTAAFNWLQTQPESLRKAATSPDTLVALFTRAQRFGSSTLESDAPVSSQAFMSDLKNLAEGLKQFEEPELQRSDSLRPDARVELRSEAPRAHAHSEYRPEAPARTRATRSTPQPPPAYAASAPQYAPAPPPQYQMPPQMTSQTAFSPSPNFVQALNDRSLAMVQDVREQLNLSTDAEAVNLMVALAYKSLRTLLV